jgi:hypothetical protein
MVFIVFGTQRFGRVDTVPGVAHLATLFFHIMFIPLFPVQSQIILDRGDRGERVLPLRKVVWKSALMAWARLWMFLGMAGAGWMAYMFNARYAWDRDVQHAIGVAFTKSSGQTTFAALAAALLVLFVLSYRLTRASGGRAEELRELAAG